PPAAGPSRTLTAPQGCNVVVAKYSLPTHASGLSPALPPSVLRCNWTPRYTEPSPASPVGRRHPVFLPEGSPDRPCGPDKRRYNLSATAATNSQPPAGCTP